MKTLMMMLVVALAMGGVWAGEGTKEYVFREMGCPDCTCEEVVERLDELLSREPMTCPAPMPLCSAAEDGEPCMTWKETVEPVTGGESVKEGVQPIRNAIHSKPDGEFTSSILLDGAETRSPFSKRRPGVAKALKWTGIAFGVYVAGRVAYHNLPRDERDVRRVTVVNVTNECRGRCR